MKVGLIAMNGTPIRDIGVVDIVNGSTSLRARLAAVSTLPSLGLLTVAAVIGTEADVEYLQCSNPDQWTALPGPFDLVAISTLSAQISDAFELGRNYQQSGVPVVIGGTHASVVPEHVIENGFVAAIGEAELIWKDILQDAKKGTLKNRYGHLDQTCDLSTSPLPRYELLRPERFPRVPVQTSRGCPHRCEFCAASILLSPKYRQKSIAQVIAEIDFIVERWRRPFIEFVDDNALVDRAYWKELLTELAARKIRWFAECDIAVGADEELLKLMQKSGCREVLIGLESALPSDVAGVELKADWKRKSHHLYRQNIENIQKHGIRVIGCFMMGLDNQSESSAQAIYEFVEQTKLFDVQLTLQTAFPGTPLFGRLASECRLRDPQDYSICTLFDLNIVPAQSESETLVQQFKRLLARLHDVQAVSARRQAFKQNLKRVKGA